MSDEDRLRERLREQVAGVPAMADLDDVAARIGQRGTGRARRLSVLVVAGLVVGSLGGYAVGRITRDDPRAVTVGGAPEPTGAESSSTAAPTTWTSVTMCAAIEPLQDQANPPCGGPPPTLPEPGPEQPADPQGARLLLEKTFAAAYDGGVPDDARILSIEDGAGLVTVFDELRNGPVGPQVRSAHTVIDGVVFLSPTRAAVEFHSLLEGGERSGPYFGDAILNGDEWQVSHASYCQTVTLAGVHCPM